MANIGKKLLGKVALVTASTEGIGFAIAKRLAFDGASVIISSRKQANVDKCLDALQKESFDVNGIACHVGKADERKRLIEFALEKKGGIDIFVSNAAVNPHAGDLLTCSEEAWDKIFEINVKSAFLMSKELVPLMEKRGGGSIVYVASIAAYQTMPFIAAYSVSKTALLGLTRALALECAPKNIRVNAVCPGLVKTKFSQMFWENQGALDAFNQSVPMKRIGEPNEIASVVSFVCSDDASFITGESLVAAGGHFSRL